MKSRKQIRKDRWWNHILFYIPKHAFGSDLREIHGYDPTQWRDAFERFQSFGEKALSAQEREGIMPLIAAQKGKEIMLTSLAEECMEFWSRHWGWFTPISATLQRRDGELPLDRLTRVAVLRMARSIERDVVGFFTRHPGIKDEKKQRLLSAFLA